jgi:hypothetical protein
MQLPIHVAHALRMDSFMCCCESRRVKLTLAADMCHACSVGCGLADWEACELLLSQHHKRQQQQRQQQQR